MTRYLNEAWHEPRSRGSTDRHASSAAGGAIMIAKPVIPGRCYQVRYQGLDLCIFAKHGCDAICYALAIVFQEAA